LRHAGRLKNPAILGRAEMIGLGSKRRKGPDADRELGPPPLI
jgi:hypothetical protein